MRTTTACAAGPPAAAACVPAVDAQPAVAAAVLATVVELAEDCCCCQRADPDTMPKAAAGAPVADAKQLPLPVPVRGWAPYITCCPLEPGRRPAAGAAARNASNTPGNARPCGPAGPGCCGCGRGKDPWLWGAARPRGAARPCLLVCCRPGTGGLLPTAETAGRPDHCDARGAVGC